MAFNFAECFKLTPEEEARHLAWEEYCASNTLLDTKVHLKYKRNGQTEKVQSIRARVWKNCYIDKDGSFACADHYIIYFGDNGYWGYNLTQTFFKDFLSGDISGDMCVDGNCYIPKKEVKAILQEVLPHFDLEKLPVY